MGWWGSVFLLLSDKVRFNLLLFGYKCADGPLNLLVDSTDIKFFGDSEWQDRKHGVQGHRQCCKVYRGTMDASASDTHRLDLCIIDPSEFYRVNHCANSSLRLLRPPSPTVAHMGFVALLPKQLAPDLDSPPSLSSLLRLPVASLWPMRWRLA